MNVVLGMLTLVPGISGGTEVYARSLCRALREVGTEEYLAMVPMLAPDAGEGLPSRVVSEYRASNRIPGRILAMTRATLFSGAVRRAFVEARPDLIHYPLTVALPSVRNVPYVTTLHDMQHELLPQMFPAAELWYRRHVYRKSARNARIIITDSNFSRDVIISGGVSPERVRSIHLGVDHQRFRPSTQPRKPFLLYPANRWVHKNHATLFEGWAMIRAKRPELQLVLTGSGHEGQPAPEGVVVEGRVSPSRLVELYQTAAALLFPSLFEGFGMPIIEAMACGCPVASSNSTSLPEVCGAAAILFDPQSPSSMAASVLRLLDDPAPFVELGLKRAALFTWEKAAREHEAVYREAAGV